MATVFESESAKNYALKHAGEIFKFQDGPCSTMLGRIVGYYFAKALLVMETDEEPFQPVDPLMAVLNHNGIPLTRGCYYSFCAVYELIAESDEKEEEKPKFPHTCTKCGFGALILFRTIECSNSGCINYYKKR